MFSEVTLLQRAIYDSITQSLQPVNIQVTQVKISIENLRQDLRQIDLGVFLRKDDQILSKIDDLNNQIKKIENYYKKLENIESIEKCLNKLKDLLMMVPEISQGEQKRIEELKIAEEIRIKQEEERKLDKQERLLDTPVEDLELTPRSHNCLRNDNIRTIRELISYTEGEILRTPNFGRKSLKEVKELLASMGLAFKNRIS